MRQAIPELVCEFFRAHGVLRGPLPVIHSSRKLFTLFGYDLYNGGIHFSRVSSARIMGFTFCAISRTRCLLSLQA